MLVRRQRQAKRDIGVAVRAAALAVSIVISAYLMALALGSADNAWLAWISLVPLFAAIRFLRPGPAALAGGWWGLCFHLFSIAGHVPGISPTFSSLALFTTVPAIYAGLGALATRALGFNPIVLGFGWIVVEAALRPVGLHQGLLAGTQAEGGRLHWATELLGYASVALIVACANASLLALLSRARWCISRRWSLSGLPRSERRPSFRVSCWVRLWAFRQAYPRAPPLDLDYS